LQQKTVWLSDYPLAKTLISLINDQEKTFPLACERAGQLLSVTRASKHISTLPNSL
jgi:hypothetical protein